MPTLFKSPPIGQAVTAADNAYAELIKKIHDYEKLRERMHRLHDQLNHLNGDGFLDHSKRTAHVPSEPRREAAHNSDRLADINSATKRYREKIYHLDKKISHATSVIALLQDEIQKKTTEQPSKPTRR